MGCVVSFELDVIFLSVQSRISLVFWWFCFVVVVQQFHFIAINLITHITFDSLLYYQFCSSTNISNLSKHLHHLLSRSSQHLVTILDSSSNTLANSSCNSFQWCHHLYHNLPSHLHLSSGLIEQPLNLSQGLLSGVLF